MVDEAEETVGFGGMDELGSYLIDAGGEIMEGDLGDGTIGVFG